MKWNLVILAGICLLMSGCATSNNKIPVESTIKRMGVVYQVHADQPFSGVVTASYISGRPKMTMEYRAGLKDGVQIEWLENGRKKESTNWRNGMRDGEQMQWYENEKIAFQGQMQSNKWVGECRGWYPDGRPAFQICFQDGQSKGRTVVIKWNKDNLMREFPDVQIDGEWIEWQATGRITRQEKYLNGALVEKVK